MSGEGVRTDRIVVVGAGAFGTALAAVMRCSGKVPVTLVGRDPRKMARSSSRAPSRCRAAGHRPAGNAEFSDDPKPMLADARYRALRHAVAGAGAMRRAARVYLARMPLS
jgi:glycerol-3-phosphate dehydrogenase